MVDDLAKQIPIEPIKVAVIGGTGDGGSPLTSGTLITPDHQPNVIIKVVSPLVAIVVRFINTYLTSIVGLLTAAGVSQTAHDMMGRDFAHIVATAASLSIAGATLGLAKDLITIFGNLEKKYPLSTGSI